jgi:hypothetical protein
MVMTPVPVPVTATMNNLPTNKLMAISPHAEVHALLLHNLGSACTHHGDQWPSPIVTVALTSLTCNVMPASALGMLPNTATCWLLQFVLSAT